MSGAVTKHVVLIGELSNLVFSRLLLDISELEQEIACRADHSAQLQVNLLKNWFCEIQWIKYFVLQRIKRLVSDEKVSVKDALRLIALYAIRYERHANCDIVGLLNQLKVRSGPTHIVPRLLEYAGQHARHGDLFSAIKITDAVKLTRSLIRGLKGVENVYTQHSCLLKETLEEVFKGRPLDPAYPAVGTDLPFRRPPQEVVVFFIGGATYEEALAVHRLNAEGYNVILGGTTIHNSDSFLKEMMAATAGITFKHTHSLQKFHTANADGI